ncbi:cell division protein FtsW, partial [Planococcus sp. SIMBA_143]
AVLLNGLGLAMIYRVDLGRDEYLGSGMTQLIWTSLGVVLAGLIVIFLKDHRLLRRYTYISGMAGLVLLLLPLVPGLGSEHYG